MAAMRIAVLDDYHGLAPGYLAGLAPEGTITYYRDTLPQNSAAELTALVERLAPFDVLCTMRERTPFPASLLARLPRLRVLLTTGTHNRAIDIGAAAERGIIVAGTPPTSFR